MSTDQPALEMARRVLIIDDSPTCRELITSHLREEGLELSEASTGETGLCMARKLLPDLILLDVTLPGWDGFDTLRQLKEDPIVQSIPVIFLSAASDTAEKARGLDLGAVDFVSKPWEPLELQARVRAALRTKYLQDLLEQRAHLDGLTGLANRAALEGRIEAEWAVCRRRASSLAVLITDLDHFKAINDRHGHHAGDEVLRRTARALRGSVRTGDFVGRFGGEEFIVVAPDCDVLGGLVMAERFRAELEVSASCHTMKVTASVGVAASFELETYEPRALVEHADIALYHAKSLGRNRVSGWHAALRMPVASDQLTVELGGLTPIRS